MIGLVLNALTFNIAAQRLDGIHVLVGLHTKGDQGVPKDSIIEPTYSFQSLLGSSKVEGGGSPTRVEVRVESGGSGVEGIETRGEGCSANEVGVDERGSRSTCGVVE